MNQTNVRLIERWLELITSHEVDKFADLFTDDVAYEDVAVGAVMKAPAGVIELLEGVYASIPDYKVTLVSAFADEDRGGSEWIMSGTHLHDMKLADFPVLPATGKPFSLRAASILRFSNGRISQCHDYWSVATFKQQVGLE